jgi:5-methylcytosine-specific restriction protein A
MASLRLCLEPGCRNLIRGKSRCPAHSGKSGWEKRQGSAMGSGWSTTRKRHLETEPMCRMCGRRATDVDHIVPRSKGGTDVSSNLQALCGPCHRTKTGREGSAALAAKRRKRRA